MPCLSNLDQGCQAYNLPVRADAFWRPCRLRGVMQRGGRTRCGHMGPPSRRP
jgi:hypothetical protein